MLVFFPAISIISKICQQKFVPESAWNEGIACSDEIILYILKKQFFFIKIPEIFLNF